MVRAHALALLLLALGHVGPAAAAPIAMSAQLRVELLGLAPVTIAGTGLVDVSGGVYQVPAGLLGSGGPVTVPVTATSAVVSLVATGLGNLSGAFSAGGATAQAPGEICTAPALGEACVVGGGIGGALGLTGVIGVHIVPHVVIFPFDLGALQVGAGGSGTTPFSFDAAVWTTRTAAANFGTFGAPSTQGGTTPGGGLLLVSATWILACGNLFPLTSQLTLTPLVPEPATLLLLGVGVLGLVAVGLRRG